MTLLPGGTSWELANVNESEETIPRTQTTTTMIAQSSTLSSKASSVRD